MNNNLKSIRESLGMRREELAYKAKCSARAIFAFEAGTRTPRLPLAIRLATVLGVGLDDIFLHTNSTKCTLKEKELED